MTALREQLESAWRRSDDLFRMVRPQALLKRPIALRQPILFYLGHLPAFAWNQIGRGVLGQPPQHPQFDELFERGIDPHDESGVPSEKGWPALSAVIAYRDGVREALRARLDDVPRGAGDDELRAQSRVVHLVIEHELMHHETLLYMLHMLDEEHLVRPDAWPALALGEPRLPRRGIDVPAGPATIGAEFDTIPFGWDNEFGPERESVSGFRIDSLPVTVGEFFEFVRADGYRQSTAWDAESARWLERQGHRHPVSWRQHEGNWQVRSLFRWVPLEDVTGWPVHVSQVEAQAFAHWKGARLASEAELHRAAYGTPDGDERPFPWGTAPVEETAANVGFRQGAPAPVGSAPETQSAFGVHELLGNGWEWTCTRFGPLKGFRAWMRTYPGYSADFFDGDHFVVFGGSWATAPRLLRRSLRNWYRRLYPYAFAKFRLAWSPARPGSA